MGLVEIAIAAAVVAVLFALGFGGAVGTAPLRR
jgi:hypothetical protein